MQRDKVAADLIASLKEQCAFLTEQLEDVKVRLEWQTDSVTAWKDASDALEGANARLKGINKVLEEKNKALQKQIKEMDILFHEQTTKEAEVQSWKMQAEETNSELKKLRKKKGKSHNIKTTVHNEHDHEDVATQT